MSIKTKVQKLIASPREIDVEAIYRSLVPYEYISFDVFDTLIKRNVKKPEDIFKIMEMSVGNDFANKRIESEHQARKKTLNEEITLSEIYEFFPDNNKLDLEIEEVKTELASIVPNLPIMEVYRRCVADGKRIFIITDMYWPLDTIKQLLQQVGVNTYEKIYLSSEENKTKRTGTLFIELLEEQKIKPNELIHIGDHFQSDYVVPKNIGIATIPIPGRLNTKCFRNKYDSKLSINYLSCLVSNTSPNGKDAYYLFGFSQFGKLLWGYSQWIHKKAVEKNIKKIFFFSRDGWIMKLAYDACINDSSIKTQYLEVSRRSLRAPILWMDFNYDNVLDMVINARLISIKSIFDGLGLDIDNYSALLSQYNIEEKTVYDRKHIRENENLKKLILTLKDDIIINSKKEYSALVGYLDTNGVSGKFGIVDIGYAGSMQRYLQQTLNAMGTPYEISGFYLAVADYYTKNDLPDNPLDMSGYLFDFKHDAKAKDIRSSYVGLFETLFLEQGGSVKRYLKTTNGIAVERYPYEYFRNGKPTEDFVKIKSLQQGALDSVSVLAKNNIIKRFHFSADDLFCGIHKTGINPDKHDLDLFGNIEFYDEGITTKLAAPQKLRHYMRNIKALKIDFLLCRWKIGFMKKLFKIRLPYKAIYSIMKKVERE